MLMANARALRKTSKLPARLAMQASTRGGSSETEVKEFAVKPRGSPSAAIVVTTVTPVTKQPSARRNSLTSISSMSRSICLPALPYESAFDQLPLSGVFDMGPDRMISLIDPAEALDRRDHVGQSALPPGFARQRRPLTQPTL